ncbi:hypothetical protein [Thermodesulfobacterium thermophilum]|nr:hypothetical protein [Thermodesulfobacterium thermophilum]
MDGQAKNFSGRPRIYSTSAIISLFLYQILNGLLVFLLIITE